jgi:hypothetical protein
MVTPSKSVGKGVLAQYTKLGSTPLQKLNSIVTADLLRKFAIEPFLADLDRFGKLSNHIADQWVKLMAGEPLIGTGRFQRSRTTTVVEDTMDGQLTTKATTSRVTNAWEKYKVSFPMGPPEFHNVVLEALGFTKPLSVLWEFKTLSFVWDYFIGIGDFIYQIEADGLLNGMVVTRLDSGYSHKVTVQCEHEFNATRPIYDQVGPTRGETTYVYYERTPGLPLVNFALPALSLPTAQQWVTIAELAFARVYPHLPRPK